MATATMARDERPGGEPIGIVYCFGIDAVSTPDLFAQVVSIFDAAGAQLLSTHFLATSNDHVRIGVDVRPIGDEAVASVRRALAALPLVSSVEVKKIRMDGGSDGNLEAIGTRE
jgi:hypothetical protein